MLRLDLGARRRLFNASFGVSMQSLQVQLKVPDPWQQKAILALQSGKDVVVSAPTGAGKTYIFEQLLDNGFSGRAVYTVPTRALANDKRMEWAARGWNVGIATGDRAENLDAPVIVATLETQKSRLRDGNGPDLLVVDEYQMLGDRQRGLNYELAIATAPSTTQLLLLSGSVANPAEVAAWLKRLGRSALVIHTAQRPVPLEEVQIEALPDRIPASVRGFWPRAIARILKAEMAPLLAFAPRRKAAESLAIELARMLPEEEPLVLTPEQERLAGDPLKRLLRARIAFHHSGLDYAQRAGLIEPLAKAGQLRVVVATMGLSAGINFSMRSVLVTDREYRSGERTHQVRPDELLQMFGRAGRRGLDRIGFVAVAHGKPRLTEARPIRLQRNNELDWPSILFVMQQAIERGEDHFAAARDLAARLFSNSQPSIGLRSLTHAGPSQQKSAPKRIQQQIREFQNPDGDWERARTPVRTPLAQCLAFSNGAWLPALAWPECLASLNIGVPCRLPVSHPNGSATHNGVAFVYGREVPVARLAAANESGELILTRWTLRALRASAPSAKRKRPVQRDQWSLDRIERTLESRMPAIASGGTVHQWRIHKDMLYARIAFDQAETFAFRDARGRCLLNPPLRERAVEVALNFAGEPTNAPRAQSAGSAADAWFQLGLIDIHAAPTLRGILFSFFNYGEGLAIAAALEDAAYPIEELLHHLANIRAGHRFAEHEVSSGRLGMACRAAFRDANFPGYLYKGLPTTYGDGAAEVIQLGRKFNLAKDAASELRTGDIERARMEWHSLLRHIAAAPDLNWPRWSELRAQARAFVSQLPKPVSLETLPPLTFAQRQRHKSFLQFVGS